MSSEEKGGRKIIKIISVVKKTKGKLIPVYILKSTRRTERITLSSVKEAACKTAAIIGKRKFMRRLNPAPVLEEKEHGDDERGHEAEDYPEVVTAAHDGPGDGVNREDGSN